MSKLKGMRFATAVIERYKRRETSVEGTVIEILWGAGMPADTVSNLNEKTLKSANEWRCRPLTCTYQYAYIDGI